MKVHKIYLDFDDFRWSRCGMDIADGVQDGYRAASMRWDAVTCKRCLATKKLKDRNKRRRGGK